MVSLIRDIRASVCFCQRLSLVVQLPDLIFPLRSSTEGADVLSGQGTEVGKGAGSLWLVIWQVRAWLKHVTALFQDGCCQVPIA